MATRPLPPQATAANKHFWNFVDVTDEETELQLYGYISEESWWGDEVTPKQFREELAKHKDKKNITVRINSGGGDVFAADAIYTSLKDHPANITVKIDGIAASAATIVAMAGDKIIIPSNAYMMIHNPLTVLWGMYNADDMEKMAKTLNTIRDGIVNAYMARTGKDRKTCQKLMDAETWMTGEEAVAEGFADELMFNDTTPQNVVVNGNRLMLNGVGFALDMLPQKVVASLSAKAGNTGENRKPNTQKDEVKVMTLEELRQAHPALVNQIEQAANTAGATAERQRIQAIDDLAGRVDPAMLAEAKYTNPSTAEAVAVAALKAGKITNTAYTAAVTEDANTSGANKVTGTVSDQDKGKGGEVKAELAHVADVAKSAMASYQPKH